jgi:hypothetical protein
MKEEIIHSVCLILKRLKNIVFLLFRLGPLQDPMFSKIGILNGSSLLESEKAIDGKYSISDELSQYFGNNYLIFVNDLIQIGYLDFPMSESFLNSSNNIIAFQYGQGGYSIAKLFRFDDQLIERFSTK